ncbi:left-right determination factor 2 [Oncorhynchus mykiss]|uniref:TGF-beta family profile domain-containing protein n=1 Tax=Oncorhynchus mykiss TaxID=8022 RepID=A0A8C7W4V8_ONCMY|nr:left-right determination factor 2 [Oncorhynchus mykiss]
MAYFPIWLLCASAILSLTHSFNQENLKEAMLQRLGLKELPRIHKRDLENLVVPSHIRNKYLTLLKLHHERRRRSLPSLAGILRGYSGNADISGEILYSDATRERLVFDMEARVPANSEVTMAELRLYQNAPHKLHLAGRKSQKQGNNARVSVYWVEVLENGANRSSLVDSRLVPIYETGWKGFDVTQAVHYWSKGRREVPLRLELRVEGERPGSYAAEMAKSMRFTAQDPSDQSTGKPELLFYTLNLEEYGSRGDCQSSKPNGICCREDHFINFRELTWTQYWVIEPAGYQSFRCAGGCKQPKRHYGYGERRCAATENAPLPIMYLVKQGDYTEIEVAEFPNMIVEKCRCTMDNVSV